MVKIGGETVVCDYTNKVHRTERIFTFLNVGVSKFTANRYCLWFQRCILSPCFSRVLLDLHQLDETEVCLGKIVKAAASLIARNVALVAVALWQPHGAYLKPIQSIT